MYCKTSNCVKTMVCGVAINSLKIILILQPACGDVKIGMVRAHENRLKAYCATETIESTALARKHV